MSQGHYNYAYRHVTTLAEALRDDIADKSDMPADIKDVLRTAAAGLAAFGELARAVEKYMSGDYGDDTLRSAYAEWRRGAGDPYVEGLYGKMLGEIAVIAGEYLPDPSELTTLDAVKRMHAELLRLGYQKAPCAS